MKYIDVSAWKRAMHCQVFRNSVNPQYCVTFHVDITNFLSQVKKRGFSFTFSFVYAVTKCANEIEEFRCRFVEGKPAIFETIHTSFTYLDKSTELFKVSFPWVSFSHISHTESGKKDNAIPLFDWGKFYEKEGKIFMPFSVQVHHSFVDGVHIGKLAEKLQCYLDSFGQGGV